MYIILTVFFMLPFIVHFLCQLQLPQHSSSSIITTSFLPHWNSAWHTGAAHCWHRAQRERPRESLDQNQRRSSCAPSIVSAKHSFSLVDQGTRKSNRYFPASASCKKTRKQICSSLEFCWQSRVLCVCVFRDLLINLCVYVVCVGWGINATNPSIHWQSSRLSKGL